MMPLTFPTLPGQSINVTKTAVTQSFIASHPSGREVRSPLHSNRWQWEVSFNGLASYSGVAVPGLGAQSLQAITSLYLSCQGAVGTFFYVDPTDYSAANQTIATGNGATNVFVAQRSIGAAVEPVSYLTSVTSLLVNGVAPTGFAIVAPNKISITPTPANGAVISATFTYQFLCRFIAPIDFEHLMRATWGVKSVKFISVQP